MGYVIMHGECIACRQLFGFNPNLVPSIPINGVRQPICRTCVDIANPRRIENGLPPIDVLPGAYEPCDEAELIWP